MVFVNKHSKNSNKILSGNFNLIHPILKKALKIGKKFEQLANNDCWDELNLLAAERQKLLEKYFLIDPLPDTKSAIQDVIAGIHRNDDKISQLIKTKKQLAIDQSLQLKSSRNAIKQYQTTSTG